MRSIDCWNAGIEAATLSLTKNHDWGPKSKQLEETLSPDDWRLKEIHAFRKRLEMSEQISYRVCIGRVLQELDKRKIPAGEWQIRFLYEHGMNTMMIMDVLKVSRKQVSEAVQGIRFKNYTHFTIQDVLQNIRSGWKVQ